MLLSTNVRKFLQTSLELLWQTLARFLVPAQSARWERVSSDDTDAPLDRKAWKLTKES
jgi:hypothetical protein